MGRLVSAVQAVMLATSRGPLAPVWGALHAAVLRAVARWLTRAAPASSAYARGSLATGRPLYGLSDMDLVIVTADGAARARVKERWDSLCRRAPLAPHLIELAVVERGELEQTACGSALTYGLGSAEAAYLGPEPIAERVLLEGRGLYGPMADWRPLGRADTAPPGRPTDDQSRRLAAGVELQSWWRYAFRACTREAGPRTAYLCVKFVSEPIRVLLWLEHGERVDDRDAALRRGLERFPDQEPAIRAALDLHGRLRRRPDPQLAEMLPHLVHLSDRVAQVLERHAARRDSTYVELDWDPDDIRGGVPLVDWRALAWSWPLEEVLIPTADDPRELSSLAEAARAAVPGLQPALRHAHLLVLAVADVEGGAGRLRAVQCAQTDPVSSALLDGRDAARFPELAGWSARDWARRAVAEHRAWLDAVPPDLDPPPLARPIAAARAALFQASVEDGEPTLPLTAAAAMRALADRHEHARGVAEAAAEELRDWRDEGRAPDPDAGRALLAEVRRLPAYAANRALELVA